MYSTTSTPIMARLPFVTTVSPRQCFFRVHTTSTPRCTDYVFGAHKFGGNAQAITGGRWVHHTSFLWDYEPQHMALLRSPPRSPEYRQVLRYFL